MKRTKLLALTLVVAIMMIGAGYAYWSETLIINNTVSTGELNVMFTGNNVTRGGDDQTGTRAAGTDPYWNAYVKHEGRLDGPETVVSEDGKMVTTKVTNMYPGAYAQYYGEVKNFGTIPAVFKAAQVTFTGNIYGQRALTPAEEEFKSNLTFAIGYKIVNEDGTFVTPNNSNMLWQSGNMNQFQDKINLLLKDVRLEPTQRLLLDFANEDDAKAAMASIGYPYNDEMHCIGYFLSKDAGNNIELQDLSIHIKIDWKQHNEPTL